MSKHRHRAAVAQLVSYIEHIRSLSTVGSCMLDLEEVRLLLTDALGYDPTVAPEGGFTIPSVSVRRGGVQYQYGSESNYVDSTDAVIRSLNARIVERVVPKDTCLVVVLTAQEFATLGFGLVETWAKTHNVGWTVAAIV